MKNGLTLFITGGAGYVGVMLADQFSKRADVKEVICLDKENQPKILIGNPKIFWITANTSDGSWQEIVRKKSPQIIIHTAWQIRELYRKQKIQWQWNVLGSQAVFDLAFSLSSVKKLIHFSTVASYGAQPKNDINYRFLETESLRESDYLYAEQKHVVENRLRSTYEASKIKKNITPTVFIIRPVGITGPRGRYGRDNFSLQSALSGSLRGKKSFLYSLISWWVTLVPVTRKWLRQYVHEDDIVDIVELLAFKEICSSYEIFNAAPPGPPLLGPDMARAVGKKMILVSPWMVRLAFFLMWHVTQGRIPTARGIWKCYCYPIAVDGSKISKQYGYQYAHESLEAFVKVVGRYQDSFNNK